MDPREKELIGIVIVGTLRSWKKRRVNILQVAEALKSLQDFYDGSIYRVSESVKLSPEMIREFLKLLKLNNNVKDLINKGLINSVDICYRISRLKNNDQILLAKTVVDKNLNSNDVRSIIRYKIDNPQIEISETIKRVLESKNKKQYIAYLVIEEDTFKKMKSYLKSRRNMKDKSFIEYIFNRYIKKENIISIKLSGRVIIIKITDEGLNKMKYKAELLSVSLSRLADALIMKHTNNKLKILR